MLKILLRPWFLITNWVFLIIKLGLKGVMECTMQGVIETQVMDILNNASFVVKIEEFCNLNKHIAFNP